MNPFTNPNPVYSHTLTRDNVLTAYFKNMHILIYIRFEAFWANKCIIILYISILMIEAPQVPETLVPSFTVTRLIAREHSCLFCVGLQPCTL
jgi:hypothetical protein